LDKIALFKLEEKMYRGFIIVLIMQLGLFIHGCTTLEHIDGSSKEERKQFKMSKYETMNKMEKVRAENVNLQRQIDILNTLGKEKQRIIDENESKIAGLRGENQNELARIREENKALNEQIKNLKSESQRMREENESKIAGLRGENENELARIREENKALNEQIKNLKSENQKVRYENKSLVKILTRQKETLSSQSNAFKKYIQKLKIKVLSRDSKNSAEKMAKKLKEMGYNIKSISYAPRSKFLRNTLYFAPEFKDEAEQLVVSLGGNTTFKPLNWPSVFDLIIVTGKNP
jgi:myosin heavy subunit